MHIGIFVTLLCAFANVIAAPVGLKDTASIDKIVDTTGTKRISRLSVKCNIASIPPKILSLVPNFRTYAQGLSDAVELFLYEDDPLASDRLYGDLFITFVNNPDVVGGTSRNGDLKRYEIVLGIPYFTSRGGDMDTLVELSGVLVHELTHVHQNSRNVPGGLIEGIADYVRAELGYAQYDATISSTQPWDAGYKHTARFLRFLDSRQHGVVRWINKVSSDRYGYSDTVFEAAFQKSVADMYQMYRL